MGTPTHGFTTKLLQQEFMKLHDIHPHPHVVTLDAKENTSDRLYFWQLYSVLGEDEMTEIITIFYRDVLSDQEDKLFRETNRFSRIK